MWTQLQWDTLVWCELGHQSWAISLSSHTLIQKSWWIIPSPVGIWAVSVSTKSITHSSSGTTLIYFKDRDDLQKWGWGLKPENLCLSPNSATDWLLILRWILNISERLFHFPVMNLINLISQCWCVDYIFVLCAQSLSHVQLCNPMNCSPPGSSVHGIFQARILEWIAISFSRGSFQPRDRTQVSHIAGRFFTVWATREAQ